MCFLIDELFCHHCCLSKSWFQIAVCNYNIDCNIAIADHHATTIWYCSFHIFQHFFAMQCNRNCNLEPWSNIHHLLSESPFVCDNTHGITLVTTTTCPNSPNVSSLFLYLLLLLLLLFYKGKVTALVIINSHWNFLVSTSTATW